MKAILHIADVKRVRSEIPNVPIFKCHRADGKHLVFWCPWCCGVHAHGWANAEPFELTHRRPHCGLTLDGQTIKGPFDKTGYYIFWDGTDGKPF